MKINLEELFGVEDTKKDRLVSQKSQFSTHHGFEGLPFRQSQALQLKTFKKDNNDYSGEFNLTKKRPNQMKRVLQSNRDKQLSSKWLIQGQLDSQSKKVNSNKIKPKLQQKTLSKTQTQNLTNKLSHRQHCKKQKCKQMHEYEASRKLQRQFGDSILTYENKQKSLTQTCQFLSRNPSSLHEYLYLEHRKRQFRNYQLATQYEQNYALGTRKSLWENPKYTKNYIPFYQRLNNEVEKRNKKLIFYQSYPIENNTILSFKPNTTTSKKSLANLKKFVFPLPRQQKNQLKGRWEMKEIEKLSRSLNKSFDNSLNRSFEIIHEKQESLIQKMKDLFEEDGYFQIKPDSIGELDEIEFQTFFPLIQHMEEQQSRVPIEEFQKVLRQYFQQLPKHDKLALRKHEIQKRKHTNNIQRELKTQRSTIYQESNQNSEYSIRNKGNIKKYKPQSDYLQKLNDFV